MINTRQLTRPSPSDSNTGDPLGMLLEGSYDQNRYSYYHNLPPKRISNRTNDIFNHSISVGGYSTDYRINGKPSLLKVGIIPFPSISSQKYIGRIVSNNNTIPFINPLIYGQVNPVAFIDKTLHTINPIAIRSG